MELTEGAEGGENTGATEAIIYNDEDIISEEDESVYDQTLNSDDPYECFHCGRKFATLHNLKIHVKTHVQAPSDKRSLQCDNCGKYYKHQSLLDKHKMISHGISSDELYECSLCTARHVTANRLHDHFRRIHSLYMNKPISCTKCSATLRDVKTLIYHYKMRHRKESPIIPPPLTITTFVSPPRADVTITPPRTESTFIPFPSCPSFISPPQSKLTITPLPRPDRMVIAPIEDQSSTMGEMKPLHESTDTKTLSILETLKNLPPFINQSLKEYAINSMWKCPECLFMFKSEETLRFHIIMHYMINSKHICSGCDMLFDSLMPYIDHYSTPGRCM